MHPQLGPGAEPLEMAADNVLDPRERGEVVGNRGEHEDALLGNQGASTVVEVDDSVPRRQQFGRPPVPQVADELLQVPLRLSSVDTRDRLHHLLTLCEPGHDVLLAIIVLTC
jgi:hypothetical protein